MTVYLDTSVILSRFLGQANALPHWGDWASAYTSVLTRVEFLRSMDRLRLQGAITDEERVELQSKFGLLWRALYHVPLADEIVSRASDPFPTVLGTLDALHLASALAVRVTCDQDLTLLTHDQQLGRAASALGLAVEGGYL